MVGLLRAPLRVQPPALHARIALRHLSTVSSGTTLLRNLSLLKGNAFHRPVLTPHRALSLGSIFGPRKPAPTPPPQVIANISSIEALADANPYDVEKQVALYNALVNAQVKAGYDVVISRWERMCEFVSINRVS